MQFVSNPSLPTRNTANSVLQLLTIGGNPAWSAAPRLANIADTGGTNRITLATASPQTSITGDFDVSGHAAIGNTGAVNSQYALDIEEVHVHDASMSVSHVGAFYSISVDPNGFTGIGELAQAGYVYIAGTTGIVAQAAALQFVLSWTGTPTVSLATPIDIYTEGTPGTVTNYIGVQLATNWGGGTFTTIRGIWIKNQAAGIVSGTTCIGLEIAAQSGATTNFGIRNASNSVQTGYARFGAVTAPANTTNGDLTCIRFNIGNAAFTSGVEHQVTGDGVLTGYYRIGSATAPTNTTEGDLTVVRLFVGDAAAVSGVEALITGDQTITGQLLVGTAAAPAASAVLELQSMTGALLLSRLTTTQRDTLTAVNGMLIYNSTLAKFQGYEAGAWTNLI